MAKSVRVRRRLFKYLPIKKKFVDESRVYDNLLLNREGMVLKPGPHRGRPPARPPDLGELITRYGLVFSPKRYGSRKNALEAALLHAKFYAGLAEKKVMHPQASVFVHNDSRKNPSISVLMPFLTTPKRGDYNSPELDFSSPLDKLKLAHPTFRFVRGSDVFFEQNYGTDPHNGEVYLHDLHVFGKPHSKQTIDWLKQTVALTKETKAWLELVGEIKKNKKKTSG